MRNLLFTLLYLSISLNSFSQDTIRLKHKNYTTVFSKSKHYPVLVEWWVTKEKVNCKNPLTRTDKFVQDPLLPNETDLIEDYKGSGFDRGHMSPAADNLCLGVKVLNECFYFSNMAPQYHSLNAGDWKSLETMVRDNSKNNNDSIHVWSGSIGEIKKIGKVSVPKYCWKVIYSVKSKKFSSFLFENNNSKPNGITDNEVSINKITKMTGFKFNN